MRRMSPIMIAATTGEAAYVAASRSVV